MRAVPVGVLQLVSRSCGRHNLRSIHHLRWSSTLVGTPAPLQLLPKQSAELSAPPNLTTPFKVLFCGTDLFAVRILQRLHETTSVCDKLAVLTPPDQMNKYTGKPIIEPVKKYALEHNLTLLTKPKARDGGLSGMSLPKPFDTPDARTLMVVASFGHLIPTRMRQRFLPTNAFNVHPSMLPQLRGAAPIQWALAYGYKKTGVSIQTLGPTFDSGAIVAQQPTDIDPSWAFIELREHLAEQSASLLIDMLQSLPERIEGAWRQETKVNNSSESSALVHAPKWDSDHARVDWDEWDPETIMARQRAFGYKTKIWTLGMFYKKKPQRVLLDDISVVPFEGGPISQHARLFLPTAIPGQIIYDDRNQHFLIRCALDRDRRLSAPPSIDTPDVPKSVLCIKKLWVEGKKPMSAREWVEGYKLTRLYHLPGVFANKKKYPIWQFGK